MGGLLKRKPRLQAIAGLVPRGSRCLADIGTDHGYIPAALLRIKKIDQAIAVDISEGPLARARRTAERYGLEERVDFRLGDGLSVLAPGDADVIVIAGMGGDTIVDILSAAPWSLYGPLLLLQPMSRAEVLRKWLWKRGARLCSEQLVQERRALYPILKVRSSGMGPVPYTEADAWGGMLLENDPLWGKYLETVILRLRRAASGLERAKDPALAARQKRFLKVIEELERRKGAWSRANGR